MRPFDQLMAQLDADARMPYSSMPVAPAQLRSVLTGLRAVLEDLRDPEPCHFDHHGYCQEHGWLDEGVCPQQRIRELLV